MFEPFVAFWKWLFWLLLSENGCFDDFEEGFRLPLNMMIGMTRNFFYVQKIELIFIFQWILYNY